MATVLPLFGILGFVAFVYALLDAGRSVSAGSGETEKAKPALIS